MVKITTNWLLGGKVDPVPLPSSIVPLHRDKENMDSILVYLPWCDEHGVRRVWRSPSEYEAYWRQRQESASPPLQPATSPPADDRLSRWRLVTLLTADRLPGPVSLTLRPRLAATKTLLRKGERSHTALDR